jgi:aromatic ring-opening dioxygenase catalytic subunit (LigB family)
MNRLPSVFVSHGAPSFAIEPGLAGPRLTALGRELPTPHAVLIVSPHWMTPSPQVGMVERPRTIHDFGGFAPALYEIDYPVHGHPQLARRALDLLQEAGWSPRPNERRGLDHGAWVPMLYLYPEADVPAFQVSLPARLDADSAWAFGQALAPHARRAHPTAEHFWPLLVAAGAAATSLPAMAIEGGITHGVLAMDSFVFGSSSREGCADDSIPAGSIMSRRRASRCSVARAHESPHRKS